MSAISTWSTTASSNNSASPNGWPEGMSPAGVNDSAREMMAALRTQHESAQWINYGHTATNASATSFTMPADLTATYTKGRRIKIVDSSIVYGYIVSSSFGATTTVNVKLDSGSLTVAMNGVTVSVGASTMLNSATAAGGLVPVGTIVAWLPGYFGDATNGTYTSKLPSANTVAAANTYLNPLGWYVCDGTNLGVVAGSPIYDAAGAFLPLGTGDIFVMGDLTAGGKGGANTADLSHTHTISNHVHSDTHTHTGDNHKHEAPIFASHSGASEPGIGYVPFEGGGAFGLGTTTAGSVSVSHADHVGYTGWGSVTAQLTNYIYGGAGNTGDRSTANTGNPTSNPASGAASPSLATQSVMPNYLSCFYIQRVL